MAIAGVTCAAACAGLEPSLRPPPREEPLSRVTAPQPERSAPPAPRAADDGDVYEPEPASESADVPSIAVLDGFAPIVGAPRDDAPRVGLVRAGQSLELRVDVGAAVMTHACPGGYRAVEPRGYVCHGPSTTLSPTDPQLEAARAVLPDATADYPLHYGYARRAARYRYLPGATEQRWNEPGLARHLAAAPAVAAEPPSAALLERLTAPDRTQSARATEREGSKVAWARLIHAAGRTWAVTPDMHLVPRDKVDEAEPLAPASIRPGRDLPLPFAFVPAAIFGPKPAFEVDSARGVATPSGDLAPRRFVALSGQRRVSVYGPLLEATDGSFVRHADVRPFALESPPPGVAPGAKWVSVRLGANTLVAYEGSRPVFAAAVSTGAHGAVAEGEHRTAFGTFRITSKWITQDMAGRTLDGVAWRSPEVPFVAYYDGARALHGAWWHDWFGRPRSHGCINLTPADARWLFGWLDPPLPEGWYAVTAEAGEGTTVVVRP